MEDQFLIKKFKYYNITILKKTPLGNYFLLIKKDYHNYIKKYKKFLFTTVDKLINTHIKIFEDFNNILNSILEWYTIALIIYSDKQNIIIHTGLAHSEKILYYLEKMFDFHNINSQGINKIKELNNNITSCFRLPSDVNQQFGGYYY